MKIDIYTHIIPKNFWRVVREKIGNDTLESLEALDNLSSIGGKLLIQDNDFLQGLSGLDNIQASSITDLEIFDNDMLSYCEVQSICDYLLSPGGTVKIQNNADGCDSREEVEAGCEYVIAPQDKGITDITIHPNPAKEKIFITNNSAIIIQRVNVFNQSGQQVMEVNSGFESLSLSTLSRGIHFLQIESDNSIYWL